MLLHYNNQILPDNIFEITKDANIKILENDELVKINHLLNFKSMSTWGVLFFLFGGLILILIPFLKASDYTTKVIGIVIGDLLISISVITLFRQTIDEFVIDNNNITLRFNLKKVSLPIHNKMRAIMKSEVVHINSVGARGTDFIHVTHFIQYVDILIPIFRFQMNNKNADEAIILGNAITKIVNNKLLEGKSRTRLNG